MKNISITMIFVLYLFSIGNNLHSVEPVFMLDFKKDLTVGVFSLGLFVGGNIINILNENTDGVLPNDISKNQVNFFDRRLMFPYNKTIETVSHIFVYGLLISPITTPLIGENRIYFNTWLTYGMMYAQTFLLTHGTAELIKGLVDRKRPFVYFGGIPSGTEDVYEEGFPSGTSSLAFMSATFFSYTFSAEYPDSKLKIPLIISSYTLATVVSAGVIFSGEHFITDVLMGAGIGSLFGWLIPVFHKINENQNRISFNFTVNGGIILVKL